MVHRRACQTLAMRISASDLVHLRRCVELAREALDDGDEPFGSVLVDDHGTVRFEDRNRVEDGDETRHPEFEIARWSASNLTPQERRTATVYTSGEHCPMSRQRSLSWLPAFPRPGQSSSSSMRCGRCTGAGSHEACVARQRYARMSSRWATLSPRRKIGPGVGGPYADADISHSYCEWASGHGRLEGGHGPRCDEPMD
jgi:hypothetical protein